MNGDINLLIFFYQLLQAVLSRKNYYTGVKYSEEPSIFAWELINEPRCESISCASDLQVTEEQ